MPANYLLIEDNAVGIRTITLNRPELHNAFDDQFIAQLQQTVDDTARADAIRVVILAANGKSFSAGADMNWMRRMVSYTQEENTADAQRLATLMTTLNGLSKPTIALVNGAAYGGGVGLVACCDIVLATEQASFCFSEVKIGLIPAVISPYVIAAMGAKSARRYFLTGERFSAADAKAYHLVDEIVASADLSTRAYAIAKQLLANGPDALAAAKALIARVADAPHNNELANYTAACIARLRASAEGQEGLSAFLEKRQPKWITHDV